MHQSELTISDALRDPIIRQVLRADRISLPSFAVFLREAARYQHENTARLERRTMAPAQRLATGDLVKLPKAGDPNFVPGATCAPWPTLQSNKTSQAFWAALM